MKALIFDVDGTLADTERQGHRIAYNRAFKDFDLDWYWDEKLYGELLKVSGGKERLHHYIETYLDEFEAPNGDGLDQFITAIHGTKTKIFVSMVTSQGMPARPGIQRIIRQARANGIRLAIATTTSQENVDALLKTSFAENSDSWFEVIAAGDIVVNKKPAPDIYCYVLEKMDLGAAQCLAFEDSENGLLSAVSASIPTIVTINDYTRTQDFSEAAVVVDHLGEPQLPMQVIFGDYTIGNPRFMDLPSIKSLHRAHILRHT